MDDELLNISLENKVRGIVSDLLNPFIVHMNDQQQLSKKLQQKFRKHKLKLRQLSNEIQQNLTQSVPFEEFKHKIDSLDSQFSTETEKLRFDVNSAKLMNDSYSVLISDLNTKIRFLENKLKETQSTSDYNLKYIREFRDAISLESTKSILDIKSFIEGQKDFNLTCSEKISKVSQSILEINSKGFPQVYTQIERRNVEISELKIFLKELQSDRVVSDDISRLKSRIDAEVWKLSEKFIKELEEIKSFLNEMLRLEISCGVSDTLLKILDSRQIKKLIPVVENQLKEDLIIYEDWSENSSSLKPVSTDALYSKAWTQTKNLENSLAGYKERISKEEEEEQKKLLERQKKLLESQNKVPAKAGRTRVNQLNLNFNSTAQRLPRMSKLETNPFAFEEFEEPDLDSVRSAEVQVVMEKVEKIQKEVKEIQVLKQNLDFFKVEVDKSSKSLQGLVENVKIEFRTNQMMQNDEFNLIIRQKTKEISEISAKFEELTKSSKCSKNQINDVYEETKVNEDQIKKLWECCKIIHQLLKHDEEDRKSLQLTGYSEGKASKTPTKNRPAVTLKPECLSCSDRNVALMSAFKMACLNYYPSEIHYSGKVFSRCDIIKKLATIISPESETIENNEDEVIRLITVDSNEKRAKSATKIRYARNVFDASLTRGLFESPSKRFKPKNFKY